ncbi:MAG: nucleotidyltransferase [Verrucomicrobiae bacterium]|nr:nucleotidyltransferase [Verrucomicrobiae bacterium]MDW8344786.1 nucleotidyl transferase AbiEii/AbiGii toxin family protein [Verrucomicrobiae bacterium]
MTRFERILACLAQALDRGAIPYMVIGGQAVMIHGRLRVTEDIDLTLGVDSAEATRVLTILQEVGLRPLVENPQQFVERTCILPMWSEAERIRVDFAFSFTPYEHQAIARAEKRKESGYPVRFASAEDLIIHKLFAGRPRDIEDIRGILARKQGRVDRSYLRHWIRQFAQLEGKGHLLPQLEELLGEWPIAGETAPS